MARSTVGRRGGCARSAGGDFGGPVRNQGPMLGGGTSAEGKTNRDSESQTELGAPTTESLNQERGIEEPGPVFAGTLPLVGGERR
jgi:hypothetical protein